MRTGVLGFSIAGAGLPVEAGGDVVVPVLGVLVMVLAGLSAGDPVGCSPPLLVDVDGVGPSDVEDVRDEVPDGDRVVSDDEVRVMRGLVAAPSAVPEGMRELESVSPRAAYSLISWEQVLDAGHGVIGDLRPIWVIPNKGPRCQ